MTETQARMLKPDQIIWRVISGKSTPIKVVKVNPKSIILDDGRAYGSYKMYYDCLGAYFLSEDEAREAIYGNNT